MVAATHLRRNNKNNIAKIKIAKKEQKKITKEKREKNEKLPMQISISFYTPIATEYQPLGSLYSTSYQPNETLRSST